MISTAENSNKFQKNQVFGEEKSVEDVVNTWANGTGHNTSKHHEIGIVRGQRSQNLLIALAQNHHHLNQSIYLANQEQVLNYVVAFANLSIIF